VGSGGAKLESGQRSRLNTTDPHRER